MIILKTKVTHAELILNYYIDNKSHLEPWEPNKGREFYDLSLWRKRLALREREMSLGNAYYFAAFNDKQSHVIGLCSLTHIMKGVFQAAYLGYSIDKQYQGRGKMHELLNYILRYAFDDLELHRVMANYMPSNARSEKLLLSLGFVREGRAQKYLKINGQWEDHILTSLLNPKS